MSGYFRGAAEVAGAVGTAGIVGATPTAFNSVQRGEFAVENYSRFYEHKWYREEPLQRVLCAEVLGTALLTFTVAALLAVSQIDTLIPVAIGGLLLALCNVFGEASGAHFNPAISFAIYAVDSRFSLSRCCLYSVVQLLGAVMGCRLAAFTCNLIKHPFTFAAHQTSYSLPQIILAETIYTALLCLTCLKNAITTHKPNPLTTVWIAGAVVAASYAVGPVSGACLNPALAMGFLSYGGSWIDFVIYTLGPMSGCAIAVVICMLMQPVVWMRRMGFHKVHEELMPESLADLECGNHK